jgi:hypothetical protein
MQHTKDTIAIRAWELRKSGMTDEQAGQQLADELAREAIGYTPAEVRESVKDATELLAATQFTERHPEWKEIADAADENVERLQELAHQYSEGEPYDLYCLECAYYQLLEDDGFERPAPEPAPKPKAQPVPAPAIKKSGHGGTLTVDPAERARLNALPLSELRKLANKDRHERLAKNRRNQLYGRDVRI